MDEDEPDTPARRLNARDTDAFDLGNLAFYPGPSPYLPRRALVFDLAPTGGPEPLPVAGYAAAVARVYPQLGGASFPDHAHLFAGLHHNHQARINTGRTRRRKHIEEGAPGRDRRQADHVEVVPARPDEPGTESIVLRSMSRALSRRGSYAGLRCFTRPHPIRVRNTADGRKTKPYCSEACNTTKESRPAPAQGEH